MEESDALEHTRIASWNAMLLSHRSITEQWTGTVTEVTDLHIEVTAVLIFIHWWRRWYSRKESRGHREMEMRQRKGRSMSEMLTILNLKRSPFHLYSDMSGFTTDTHTQRSTTAGNTVPLLMKIWLLYEPVRSVPSSLQLTQICCELSLSVRMSVHLHHHPLNFVSMWVERE